MVWRRKKRVASPDSLEDRYRALVRLVLRRGFEPQGLVLIEADGGFLVRGVRDQGRRGAAKVATETIAADELLAELEELEI